jgi:hypothetical protein
VDLIQKFIYLNTFIINLFRETRFKENIVYHEENDTIRYTQPVTYLFREDLSHGLVEKDLLTVINIPLVVISIIMCNFLISSIIYIFLK